MGYSQLLDYSKKVIERLGLPLDILTEVVELYQNFKRDNIKCISHYEQEDVIKCVVLSIARKEGYYVLMSEILEEEQNISNIYNISNTRNAKSKKIRVIYKKLKKYLKNPEYMNFNTGNYINRVGQLLDLQYKDLEIIFANISNNETPVSILSKFAKCLDINFDELSKVKPSLSEVYLKNKY